MTSVTVDADQVGWPSRGGRAGRFGLLFAGVWLVFLVDSLRAAWRLAWRRGTPALAGWVGLVATVAFAASYLAVFSWIRGRRRRLQLRVPAREAWAMLAGLLRADGGDDRRDRAGRAPPRSCTSPWSP